MVHFPCYFLILLHISAPLWSGAPYFLFVFWGYVCMSCDVDAVVDATRQQIFLCHYFECDFIFFFLIDWLIEKKDVLRPNISCDCLSIVTSEDYFISCVTVFVCTMNQGYFSPLFLCKMWCFTIGTRHKIISNEHGNVFTFATGHWSLGLDKIFTVIKHGSKTKWWGKGYSNINLNAIYFVRQCRGELTGELTSDALNVKTIDYIQYSYCIISSLIIDVVKP